MVKLTKIPAKRVFKRDVPDHLPAPKLADPGGRFRELIARHSPEKILKALRDEKFLEKEFSTYDGVLIMAIGAALKGNGDERERMFNRMFGKVPDKTINLNLNVDVTPAALSSRAQEILGRIEEDADLVGE